MLLKPHRRERKKSKKNITNCWKRKKRRRSAEAVDPDGC